ncbi:transcriptional regulator, CarD family [Clostridium collagenovorans DSM 3089]|uniref:Transcriptional regulator, CarD family n=1 Tax=Clostridium collagenovorans DSM 3089 TaxID=1121306 RepID=A0A1M5Y3W1_9CLOT|nr:CarD family transcriptional regulator [Clostridium collagenovorans]SHI06760.1 transcriptional regulator, CarD family [Clostridium collagenovorans DSM 3089]
MFEVNDYVMYGMTGVCKVIDIKKEKLMDDVLKEYYVLSPVYSKNTVIKIPVDNKKIPIRKVLSEGEVDLAINNMNDTECLWINDDKLRNEKFKAMLKSGECDNLMTLVKSIYSNKCDKQSNGKKIGKNDEEIMQTAEKLLNEEFATVLDISPESVKSYIKSHTSDED